MDRMRRVGSGRPRRGSRATRSRAIIGGNRRIRIEAQNKIDALMVRVEFLALLL